MKLALVNVPFTFVNEKVCPLEQVSIETLKAITHFKKTHDVKFINMRSKDSFAWMKRDAGEDSKKKLQMMIASKPQSYLRDNLKEFKPDRIIVICNFALAPYTFDTEVIKSVIRIAEKYCKDVQIGGEYIDLYPKYSCGLKTVNLNFEDKPDINNEFGLFQLTKGCSNSCSFCVAGLTKPQKIPVDFVVSYMREYFDKHKPDVFWNWDPNVLLFPDHFEEFLDKYLASGMKARLNFALGFQPNLLKNSIIKKLDKIGIDIITLPVESGTLKSKKNIGKPYSILDSIKKIKELKKCKNIKKIQCSFIIGYPHDEFKSIFRTFVTIVKLGCHPIPFPLYVFPKTKEHKGDKEVSDLHGQLWPMINSEEIPLYQNLLRFLATGKLDDKDLDPRLKNVYRQELRYSEKFLKMADGDLEQIEKELYEDVLYISVSPGSKAVSKKLGEYFIEKYRSNHNVKLTRLDLYKEDIEFLDDEFIDVIYRRKKVEDVSEKTRKTIKNTDRFISMLKKADTIIITTPMWTMSIPGILKSMLESIASRMYYDLGEKFEKKQVYCILTRDGVYEKCGKETDPLINVQELSLMAALDFIGIGREIDFITAQGLGMDKDANIKKAKKEIDLIL